MNATRLACALLLTATAARAAPSLGGNREMFVVADCAAATVELRFDDDSVPVAIRTGDVAPVPAATPPGWTVEWDRPVATDQGQGAYLSVGHLRGGCPQAGIYRLPLTVVGSDRQTDVLQVTLARVFEPALSVPSSVTLETGRLFGAPRPAGFTIRETAPSVAPVPVRINGGELLSATGVATGLSLEPAEAVMSLRAGGVGTVSLSPSAPPAPGAYTARLAVFSPALAREASVDVVYRVRLDPAVLLGVIVLGVVLGLLVNGVLASRAVREAAVLAGLRVMDEIARRAGGQRDPAVQQRLLAVATQLQAELRGAETPAEAEKAAGAAQAEAKRIEDVAVADAASLQQVLQVNRAIFRPGGEALDELLAGPLAAPAGAVEALIRAADAGEVEETRARLQDLVGGLREAVLPPLHAVLAEVAAGLDDLGPVPGPAEGVRLALRQRVGEAFAARDPADAVGRADEVARRLRSWMTLDAPEVLAASWREAAQSVAAQNGALAQQLRQSAEAADALRAPGRELLSRLRALATLSGSVHATLAAAIGDDNAAAREKLGAGDVEGAAQLLGGPLLLGRFRPSAQSMVAAEAAVPAPAQARAVLRVRPLIPVGQNSLVLLRWVGGPPPREIAWRCEPEGAAELKPVPAGLLARPTTAGFVSFTVQVADAAAAEVSTYAGAVGAQPEFVGVARRKWWTDAALALAAGVLTVVAGYEVLVPTWFGTLGDLFGAFSWGFFGQFGLDRVRQLVSPITGKSLPH